MSYPASKADIIILNLYLVKEGYYMQRGCEAISLTTSYSWSTNTTYCHRLAPSNKHAFPKCYRAYSC